MPGRNLSAVVRSAIEHVRCFRGPARQQRTMSVTQIAHIELAPEQCQQQRFCGRLESRHPSVIAARADPSFFQIVERMSPAADDFRSACCEMRWLHKSVADLQLLKQPRREDVLAAA